MAAEQDALSSDPSRHRSFVTEVRPRLDRFSQCLLDLPGLGVPSQRYRASIRDRLQQRTAVADATLRYYVGLLAQQHRSAVGLEGILQEYFSVEVAVLQFVGQWLLLERENQTQLIAGGNIELGTTAVIGQRVRDLQGRFRIRIGPMTYDQFQQLLPSGKGYRGLTDLARLYAGCTFDIDAQLVLKASEVPWCEVGCHADQPALLGWNTWIRGHDLSRDVDDTVLLLAG
jgi:type VI secretion system protein ImpH